MKQSYQISDRGDSRDIAEFLAREGQLLLPMLEFIDVMGRATIEAVLLMSAEQVAGPRTPGKKGDSVRWHGRQNGVVALSERKLRISKPRLRDKERGEVNVPAYDAMQSDSRLGQRVQWGSTTESHTGSYAWNKSVTVRAQGGMVDIGHPAKTDIACSVNDF